MSEHCPHHTDANEAINRKAIWHELHDVFDVTSTGIVETAVSRRGERAEYTDRLELAYESYSLLKSENPLVEHAEGFFGQYTSSNVAVSYPSSDFQPLRIPIGMAGEAFAARLLASAAWLAHITESSPLREMVSEQAEIHKTVLKNHTFRGVQTGDPHEALQVSLQQGIVTAAHALALVIAEIPPSAAESTVYKFVEKRQAERLARGIGSAAVSTLVRYGRYVRQPLTEVTEISPQLRRYADATRNFSRAHVTEQRSKENELPIDRFDASLHQSAGMGMTCPATKGPIQRLSEALLDNVWQ